MGHVRTRTRSSWRVLHTSGQGLPRQQAREWGDAIIYNEIVGYSRHLTKRTQTGSKRLSPSSCRKRRENYVPAVSALDQEVTEEDPDNKKMLKLLDFVSLPNPQVTRPTVWMNFKTPHRDDWIFLLCYGIINKPWTTKKHKRIRSKFECLKHAEISEKKNKLKNNCKLTVILNPGF